jgi:hypothetical protein
LTHLSQLAGMGGPPPEEAPASRPGLREARRMARTRDWLRGPVRGGNAAPRWMTLPGVLIGRARSASPS